MTKELQQVGPRGSATSALPGSTATMRKPARG